MHVMKLYSQDELLKSQAGRVVLWCGIVTSSLCNTEPSERIDREKYVFMLKMKMKFIDLKAAQDMLRSLYS